MPQPARGRKEDDRCVRPEKGKKSLEMTLDPALEGGGGSDGWSGIVVVVVERKDLKMAGDNGLAGNSPN